jgi:hypothetical protein
VTRKEWQAIDRARRLLQLGEAATSGEIRRAYRNQCKRYHPDLAGASEANKERMHQINQAYALLQRYCEQYRFPLVPEEEDIYDAEDWWMERFGPNVFFDQKPRRRR